MKEYDEICRIEVYKIADLVIENNFGRQEIDKKAELAPGYPLVLWKESTGRRARHLTLAMQTDDESHKFSALSSCLRVAPKWSCVRH
ncbi:hypothetical protein EVAR_61953_1 [Eumeta japonica]|uniref:Uncharacterized protein n=1 Tax=Eumeta variegata TaxID=151549 RepID=A0A4C1ZMA7_EUMVA|nr:hypothetical protein EVAR_61953_1 [Eumeta japonica]